jgi:hypothetical protein
MGVQDNALAGLISLEIAAIQARTATGLLFAYTEQQPGCFPAFGTKIAYIHPFIP